MKNIPLKKFYLYIILAFCIAASVLFVQNNDSFYERTIAEVKAVKTHQAEEVTDIYNNEDRIYEQQIVAEITNGEEKGQQIHLSNQFSKSKAYDYEIQTGQKLFVSIRKKSRCCRTKRRYPRSEARPLHTLDRMDPYPDTAFCRKKTRSLFHNQPGS